MFLLIEEGGEGNCRTLPNIGRGNMGEYRGGGVECRRLPVTYNFTQGEEMHN